MYDSKNGAFGIAWSFSPTISSTTTSNDCAGATQQHTPAGTKAPTDRGAGLPLNASKTVSALTGIAGRMRTPMVHISYFEIVYL